MLTEVVSLSRVAVIDRFVDLVEMCSTRDSESDAIDGNLNPVLVHNLGVSEPLRSSVNFWTSRAGHRASPSIVRDGVSDRRYLPKPFQCEIQYLREAGAKRFIVCLQEHSGGPRVDTQEPYHFSRYLSVKSGRWCVFDRPHNCGHVIEVPGINGILSPM